MADQSVDPQDFYGDVTRLSIEKELKDLAVAKDIMRLAQKINITQLEIEQLSQSDQQSNIDHTTISTTFSNESPSAIHLNSNTGGTDTVKTLFTAKKPLGVIYSHFKEESILNPDNKVYHTDLLQDTIKSFEKLQSQLDERNVAAADEHGIEPIAPDNPYRDMSTLSELALNVLHIDDSIRKGKLTDAESEDSDDEDECHRIDQKRTIFHLIYALKQHLCDSIQVKWDSFHSTVFMNDHETITKYLIDTFGEDGILTLLLKSCHQTIIAKILRRFRNVGLTFKDVRGSWRIEVRLYKGTNRVSTIHRRKEQMIYRDESGFGFDNLFQFQWELETFYDVEKREIINVEIRLLEIEDVTPSDTEHPEEFQRLKDKLFTIFMIPVKKRKKKRFRICTIL